MKRIIVPLFCLLFLVGITSLSAEEFEISPDDIGKLLEFIPYIDDPFINIPAQSIHSLEGYNMDPTIEGEFPDPITGIQNGVDYAFSGYGPSHNEANDKFAVIRMLLLVQNTTETKKTLTIKETMPSIVLDTKVFVLEADSFSLEPEDILNLEEAKKTFNKTTKEISIPIEIEANATEIYMIYASCKGVEETGESKSGNWKVITLKNTATWVDLEGALYDNGYYTIEEARQDSETGPTLEVKEVGKQFVVLPRINSGDTLTIYVRSGEKTPLGKILPFLGILGGITTTVGKTPVIGDTIENIGGPLGLLIFGGIVIILLIILIIIGIKMLLKKDHPNPPVGVEKLEANARIQSQEDYLKLKNMVEEKKKTTGLSDIEKLKSRKAATSFLGWWGKSKDPKEREAMLREAEDWTALAKARQTKSTKVKPKKAKKVQTKAKPKAKPKKRLTANARGGRQSRPKQSIPDRIIHSIKNIFYPLFRRFKR